MASVQRNTRIFDLDDACRLKSAPSLIGHVSRTHCDIHNHGPLGDILLLSCTSVPDKILVDFIHDGAPPKGYVFVTFAEPSQGCTLVHEDDLELVDRVLEIGEVVKRHPDDTASGTVISSSAKCSLEPIAYRVIEPTTGEYSSLKFAEKANHSRHAVDIEPDHTFPPLLHDVPMSELTDYEEFNEGDYIIYRQKLGIINHVDRDAVLLLPNQKCVNPVDSTSMEVPLCLDTGSIVAMPASHDTVRSYPSVDGGFLWSIESEIVYPGQFALTSAGNLSRGNLNSDGGSSTQPEGHILATPALDYHIGWLCPNVFAHDISKNTSNTEVIRAHTMRGDVVKCDFGQFPMEGTDSTTVKSDTWLKIGDRVRFRNSQAAEAKYPLYQHIPADESFGHDVNILRVTLSKTEVRVQWQDGSITTEEATSLHKFTHAEDEVWPGNFVVLKESVVTFREPLDISAAPYLGDISDMVMDNLRLGKVGVVQTVDSRERIASVRWYEDPKVEMMQGGVLLKPQSVLGQLGDTITEVSLYELRSYPCLTKSLDDLVVIVPETVHEAAIRSPDIEPPKISGSCQFSSLSPISFIETFVFLESLKLTIVDMDWFHDTITIDTSPLPPSFSFHLAEFSVKSPTNFIGKIISVDVNGEIIVRLAGADNCRDIRVPMERIMMVMDDENALPFVSFPPIDVYNLADNNPFAPSMTETVEYEGGERLDNDLGDDDWLTEEDSEAVESNDVNMDDNDDVNMDDNEDVNMDDNNDVNMDDSNDGDKLAVPEVSEIQLDRFDSGDEEEAAASTHHAQDSQESEENPSKLSFPLPSECPPAFCLLEGPPPSDHRFIYNNITVRSGVWMRRIYKEFEILRSSLPPGIFVRTWESRVDILRVLIIGPSGTPYEHAPFVIDLHFAEDFPSRPPVAHFHSWTRGQGPVNPNLYENGKICLSILGTWPTQNPEETWSADKSTVLQILVSIMGLVLVKTPFYNEAGYEILAVDDNRRVESTLYTEKTFLLTRKFIQRALEHPVASLEDVVAWHYLAHPSGDSTRPRLLRRAIDDANKMIEHHNRIISNDTLGEDEVATPFVARLSLGAVVMLRKHLATLEKIELAASSGGTYA